MSCLPSRLQLPIMALLCLPALLASPRAEACGGLFCDNLPDPMPVDQNSEDILFVTNGESIEVHVRIAYTGEAERFAWVVPIQAIPEVAVGSDALFNAMGAATQPQWGVQTVYECESDIPPPPPDDDWDTGGESGDPSTGDGDGDGGPSVVFEETVGAFEVIVLQGGTAQEVVDFLNANDYQQDPEAVPIMQEYLDEDFLFAAVKLTAAAEVEEIHPLAFTFPGDEPCVPLRLTRIAAQDDMQIRTYFLGDERWAPSNYAHVVLNPLAMVWEGGGYNNRVVTQLGQAIDDAGGRAFATEYSGTSDAVNTNAVYRVAWDSLSFNNGPASALEELVNVGLIEHPLIISLLMQYIPPPDGIPATEFWNWIFDYQDLIDYDAWDPDAFLADLEERIIGPGRHAADMLAAWPTLTRMRAIMSPGEMLEDPVFHQNPDLPEVARGRSTTELLMCGLVDRTFIVDLEGEDYNVCVPQGDAYPASWDMPAALRIEQIPLMGPPQVVTDNRALIDSLFTSYDEGVVCTSYPEGETGGDGDGDGGTDGSGTDGGDTDGSGTDGEDTDGGTSGGDPGLDDGSASCACSAPGRDVPLGAALGLLVLGLLGPWRRRD